MTKGTTYGLAADDGRNPEKSRKDMKKFIKKNEKILDNRAAFDYYM